MRRQKLEPRWRRCSRNSQSTRWLSRCCNCYIDGFRGGILGISGTGSMQPSSPRCRALRLVFFVPLWMAIGGSVHAQRVAPPGKNAGGSSPPQNLIQAQELMRQERFAEAKSLVEDQLRLAPSDLEAYNLLGIIGTNERNYPQAEEAFQHALSLNPGSATTHNNLGNLYIAEQKPDLAEKEFNLVLKSAPSNRDANYNLGLLLLAKGSPVGAIAHFQRVHPQTVETRFNLIRAYFAAGRNPEALAQTRELSAAHRQDVQLHFTLGLMLASAKQYKTAQQELEQANALKPETFEILHNLGQ